MIKVMIVEDDPMVRDINAKFLNKLTGFILEKSVSSLKEAEEEVKKSEIHLILLDIFLPKENGLEFLKQLRKAEINIDVILITADKSIDAVQEAFRYGAVDYLVKPFTFERFKESLYSYKERKIKLEMHDKIEQEVIDKYIANNKGGERLKVEDNSYLVKGLNQHTYNKVWNVISEWHKEYFTAEQISEKIGMARVTVRRYLEFMEKEDKLDIKIEYGKIGRPQHKYKQK